MSSRTLLALSLVAFAWTPEVLAKPKRTSGASRAATPATAGTTSTPVASTSLGTSGASRMTGSSSDFTSCVEEAVAGRVDQDCVGRGEADSCVGLRRAVENSQKKSLCLRKRGPFCAEWGHNGRTQSHWLSIAAGHLAKFGDCVRDRYGSEDHVAAMNKAAEDPALIEFLKKIDDGSRVYRLSDGKFLIRALHRDRFSAILDASPLAKDIDPQDFTLLKDGADTAMVFASKPEGGEGTSNPAAEGLYFKDAVRDFLAASEAEGEAAPLIEPQVLNASALPAGGPALPNAFAPEPARAPASRKMSPYSLGLDRSLFERVSAAYFRNSADMRGIDEMLRVNPPAPPKDIGELLSRGGTL